MQAVEQLKLPIFRISLKFITQNTSSNIDNDRPFTTFITKLMNFGLQCGVSPSESFQMRTWLEVEKSSEHTKATVWRPAISRWAIRF